jgi:hypothetical protein
MPLALRNFPVLPLFTALTVSVATGSRVEEADVPKVVVPPP